MATNNSINAPFPIPATDGGTGVTSPTAHGIVLAHGASAMTSLVLAAGQVAIGTTAGDPAPAALTAGSGISITSATGSITIASTGGPAFVDQTGAAVTMADNTAYSANNAGLVTLTIPATSAFGTTYTVCGQGAGGWKLQANTGQVVNFGNAPTTTAGSLASTNRYDAVSIYCSVADTTFNVMHVQGNLTVA
jgi:hypothetical protein